MKTLLLLLALTSPLAAADVYIGLLQLKESRDLVFRGHYLSASDESNTNWITRENLMAEVRRQVGDGAFVEHSAFARVQSEPRDAAVQITAKGAISGFVLNTKATPHSPLRVEHWRVNIFEGSELKGTFNDIPADAIAPDAHGEFKMSADFARTVRAQTSKPYRLRAVVIPYTGALTVPALRLTEDQTHTLLRLPRRSPLQACLALLLRH